MQYDILDMAAVRVQHSLLLLRLLWEQDAPRVDLSKRVGLSRSAISSIVTDLIGCGLVCEGEARVSGGVGRRATMLSLQPGAAALLSVDLGASHLRVAVLDLRCRVLAAAQIQHDVLDGPAATYPLVRRLADRVLRAAGVGEERVAAVGVGVPGPVDGRSGRVVRPPNMPGWDGEAVGQSLEALFRAPVFVENDANVGALAEWRFGQHAGVGDLLYVKAATGIGAGILLGGQLYRGVLGGAGEIGHISINEQGPPSRSGNPGSLESYAAVGAVMDEMRRRLPAYPQTRLNAGSTVRDLVRDPADPLAHALLSEVGRHLGVAVTTALNLLNPAAVVFGGQLALAGDVLVTAVQGVVNERALQINRDGVRITRSRLGRDVGVLGGGVLALESLLTPHGWPRLRGVAGSAGAVAGAAAPASIPAPGQRVVSGRASRAPPERPPFLPPGLPAVGGEP